MAAPPPRNRACNTKTVPAGSRLRPTTPWTCHKKLGERGRGAQREDGAARRGSFPRLSEGHKCRSGIGAAGTPGRYTWHAMAAAQCYAVLHCFTTQRAPRSAWQPCAPNTDIRRAGRNSSLSAAATPGPGTARRGTASSETDGSHQRRDAQEEQRRRVSARRAFREPPRRPFCPRQTLIQAGVEQRALAGNGQCNGAPCGMYCNFHSPAPRHSIQCVC